MNWMFDLEIFEILLNILDSMAEQPQFICSAIFIITNIINDTDEIMRRIISEENGELIKKSAYICCNSRDSLVHLNTLKLINIFIMRCSEDIEFQEILVAIER